MHDGSKTIILLFVSGTLHKIFTEIYRVSQKYFPWGRVKKVCKFPYFGWVIGSEKVIFHKKYALKMPKIADIFI